MSDYNDFYEREETPPWCNKCGRWEDDCVGHEPQDEWETISAQLDYWADLDKEYWRQRKEKEYEAYFNRKLQEQKQ